MSGLGRDLRSSRWIVAKGLLFVLLGVLASAILLLLAPRVEVAALLAIAVWAFCRAYYFAFYVIERYVDPSYRFDGLFSACRWLLTHRAEGDRPPIGESDRDR